MNNTCSATASAGGTVKAAPSGFRLYLSLHSAVLAAIFIATGCDKQDPMERQDPLVDVTKPVVKDIQPSIEVPGVLRSPDVVEVRARVRGFLTDIYFDDGQKVEGPEYNEAGDIIKLGTPLFRIEQAQYQAKVLEAEARVNAANAVYTPAVNKFNREQILVKTNAVTEQQFEITTAELYQAIAAKKAADAALKDAQRELSYTVINAPATGRVTRRMVDKNNLVGYDGSTLLATVVADDPMYAYFDVSERDLLRFLRWQEKNPEEAKGAKIMLALEDEDTPSHEGILNYIDPQVNPNTGVATARATFPNKRGLLFPGFYTRVFLPMDPIKSAILVDEKAISRDLRGSFIYVVVPELKTKDESGKEVIVKDAAIRRSVELGPLMDGMRVIMPAVVTDGVVEKGIMSEERYVIQGIGKVIVDKAVTPTFEKPAVPESPALDGTKTTISTSNSSSGKNG